MTDSRSSPRSNLGPSSTRRRLATIIAVVGIAFVGSRLGGAWPREASVSYEVGPHVKALDVDFVQDGESVLSARFKQSERKTRVFRHTARLQPGEYRLLMTLHGDATTPVEVARTLVVPAGGATVFDLRGEAQGHE